MVPTLLLRVLRTAGSAVQRVDALRPGGNIGLLRTTKVNRKQGAEGWAKAGSGHQRGEPSQLEALSPALGIER